MPIAILLIVGLVVYNSGVIDKVKNPNQGKVTEVVAPKTVETKIPVKEIKQIPKQPEPIKEEVKVEAKQPEPIKEEVKVEAKQPEPIKEEVKVEAKQPEPIKEEVREKIETQETATKEVQADEPESDYLKIILYIVGAIATIFGGFYFFSNRGSNQPTSSTIETARRDIEENYQPEPEPQDQQPVQEETQTETQDQKPAQEETQTETQDQKPAQEETQTETIQTEENSTSENTNDQSSNNDDENNNK
jgi:hypothetical protein